MIAVLCSVVGLHCIDYVVCRMIIHSRNRLLFMHDFTRRRPTGCCVDYTLHQQFCVQHNLVNGKSTKMESIEESITLNGCSDHILHKPHRMQVMQYYRLYFKVNQADLSWRFRNCGWLLELMVKLIVTTMCPQNSTSSNDNNWVKIKVVP